MMYLTEKTEAALNKKASLSGHEELLEKHFISEYNHAAPIYVRNSENPQVIKSDIWRSQRSDIVKLEEILQSDTFRIDPSKLVDARHAKMLEQIDYGYKKDADGNYVVN